ncbi:MAG TPA: hypothetical protein VIF60_23635 [Burkholderiaceae bacterium]|jgi:hypothetical protein
MRKGYWRALLQRLRGRVVQGDIAIDVDGFRFIVHEISAADDLALEQQVPILVAVDASANALLIEPGTTEVTIRLALTGQMLATGMAFIDMIDSLKPVPADGASALTASVEDELILARLLRGSSSRARGIFDDEQD